MKPTHLKNKKLTKVNFLSEILVFILSLIYVFKIEMYTKSDFDRQHYKKVRNNLNVCFKSALFHTALKMQPFKFYARDRKMKLAANYSTAARIAGKNN
jgi:hypothetical protein